MYRQQDRVLDKSVDLPYTSDMNDQIDTHKSKGNLRIQLNPDEIGRLRIVAAHAGLSMRAYVTMLVRKELNERKETVK